MATVEKISFISKLIDEYISKKQTRQEWKPEGVYYHPWHIYRKAKNDWTEILNSLINSGLCYRVKSFDDIYNEFEGKRIPHIGPLTLYDTALAVAIYFKNPDLSPKEVYLQAGAAKGAKCLGIKGRKVSPDIFNRICADFSKLTPAEIEDFLCVYHNRLCNPCCTNNPSKCLK